MREHGLYARTVQLKLRYQDFTTITRARTLEAATQLDTDLHREARALFLKNWTGKAVRLLGVHTSSLEAQPDQMSLDNRMHTALRTADHMRDRFGESAISLAAGLPSRDKKP